MVDRVPRDLVPRHAIEDGYPSLLELDVRLHIEDDDYDRADTDKCRRGSDPGQPARVATAKNSDKPSCGRKHEQRDA